MEIPILVEPIANNGYQARSGEPLALTAQGATREEALSRLRELLTQKLSNGVELRTLAVPAAAPHPLAEFAGIFSPDDPMVQEWIEIMAENRRKDEEDSDCP